MVQSLEVEELFFSGCIQYIIGGFSREIVEDALGVAGMSTEDKLWREIDIFETTPTGNYMICKYV